MPETTRRVRNGKIFTFSINERVFTKLENRFGMITGRNIRPGADERLCGNTSSCWCVVGMWFPIGFHCLDVKLCTRATVVGCRRSPPQHGLALCQGPAHTSDCG